MRTTSHGSPTRARGARRRTAGLDEAGECLEERFQALGLAPAGDAAAIARRFPRDEAVKAGSETAVTARRHELPKPTTSGPRLLRHGAVKGRWSSPATASSRKNLAIDDYAKLDVKGRIVVVRRFAPDGPDVRTTEAQRRFGDIRCKAWNAREHGAKALIVVDCPVAPEGAEGLEAPDEAALPASRRGLWRRRHAGRHRQAGGRSRSSEKLAKEQEASPRAGRACSPISSRARSTWRRSPSAGARSKLPGRVVVGAHYDHLGHGGRDSLAPDRATSRTSAPTTTPRAPPRCSRWRARSPHERARCAATSSWSPSPARRRACSAPPPSRAAPGGLEA